MTSASDFQRIGGEPVLRAIIDDFVGRVFDDVMIGFIFQGKSRARLREMEYRHAAQHLGGPVAYTGRSMRQVHGPLPILGGHFRRRRQILINVLDERGVPEDIRDRWIAYQDSLKDQILGRADDVDCNHDLQLDRHAAEGAAE